MPRPTGVGGVYFGLIQGLSCSELSTITLRLASFATWVTECQRQNKYVGAFATVTGSELKMNIALSTVLGPFGPWPDDIY